MKNLLNCIKKDLYFCGQRITFPKCVFSLFYCESSCCIYLVVSPSEIVLCLWAIPCQGSLGKKSASCMYLYMKKMLYIYIYIYFIFVFSEKEISKETQYIYIKSTLTHFFFIKINIKNHLPVPQTCFFVTIFFCQLFFLSIKSYLKKSFFFWKYRKLKSKIHISTLTG